jgi:hypothetical protein
MVTDEGNELYAEHDGFDRGSVATSVSSTVYPMLNQAKYGRNRRTLSELTRTWLDRLPQPKVQVFATGRLEGRLFLELLGQPHPKLMPLMFIFDALAVAATIRMVTSPAASYASTFNQAKDTFYFEYLQYFLDMREQQHHALSEARALRRAYFAVLHRLRVPK